MIDDFGPDLDEEGQPLEEGESDRIKSDVEREKPGRTDGGGRGRAEAESEREKAEETVSDAEREAESDEEREKEEAPA